MAKVPEVKIRDSDGLSTGWGGTGLHVVGSTRFLDDVTVLGVQKHENSSSSYVNGRNTVVKVATANASTELRSGAIYIPANSVVRSITVVITTALVWAGSKKLGVRAGVDNSSDETFCALVDNSLYASATSAAATAGVGTSSDPVLQADLGGNAALALSGLYTASAVEIHTAVVPNAGTITSGAVSFIVEFDYLGGN